MGFNIHRCFFEENYHLLSSNYYLFWRCIITIMTTYSTKTQAEIKQYPLGTFWRYFLYVSLTGLIGLFSWLGYYMLINKKSDISPYLIIAVMLLLICGCVYMLLLAYNEKLLVETDRFTYQAVYSSHTIYFTDVKGFKVNENYILIIPQTTAIKKITLSKYIARADELKQYLADNFTNLDMEEYEDQLTDILTDNSLGFTEEEREQKLKKAKLLANVINWPSYVICGLLIFYPKPYLLLMTLAVLWPLLAIAALKSNTLIRFDEEKNSPYPGITLGFIMPFAGFGVRLIRDLSLLSFDNIWLPTCGLFVILLLILLPGNRSLNFSSGKKTTASVLLMLFVFLYCLAASAAVNCLYDNATPTEYQVKVVNKNISRGKSTSYNLVLEKWGTQTEGEQEMVSSDKYNNTQIGDKVTVACRPGILGAPWYTVH